MLYAYIIFTLLAILFLGYYISVIGNILGFWKIYPYEIDNKKLLTPFYYWFNDEKKEE